MRLFTAALSTETNTFSPVPTTLSSFSSFELYRPGEAPAQILEFAAPLWVARQRAISHAWDIVEGTCANALPAGITTQIAYESLRNEILDQLRLAMPVDAVALGMHGAMVAERYQDCEGDFLNAVREIVGKNVPIGLEIDPHCHLTQLMLSCADSIVIFKEYPHTDYLEGAEALLDILEGMVLKELKPCFSVFDCRMQGIFHTTRNPMKEFVSKLRNIELYDGVLSVSVAHGFPWGDVKEGGTKVLVTTNDRPELGRRLAEELGRELFDMRGNTHHPAENMYSAVRQVLKSDSGPIIFADTSDNPGGGAPGDSTYLLIELINQGITDVCLGAIWDPTAVRAAIRAGVGAAVKIKIGGSEPAVSGLPVEADATVTAICRNSVQTFATTKVKLGDCVAIHFEGVDIVLSSIRSQTLGMDLFTNLGIDPKNYRLVVVKSSQHFFDAFAPIAKEVHYIDTPGALTQDIVNIDYVHLSKAIWPFVDNPLQEA